MNYGAWKWLRAGALLLILTGLTVWGVLSRAADTPADSYRETEIFIAYTQNEWWLMRWEDNRPVCRVFVDHEGVPTAADVQANCETALYTGFINTRPCDAAAGSGECDGYYLHFIESAQAERTIAVKLPIPKVWITLQGCNPIPLENRCQQLPTLVFTAEEPLPNEYIAAIYVTLDGEPVTCPGDRCEIPLNVTRPGGLAIEFWADSSYGDASPHYTARVRVIDTGLQEENALPGYFVDILSTQWLGDGIIASCAQSWQSFPPLGGAPNWLANPSHPDELVSGEPFGYLAGKLISSGVVDAKDCPAGGLMANGWASTCGLDKAKPVVEEWQNRFNEQIIAGAQDAGIPSQLLKNLFAQESQFWPGALTDLEIKEYGFGRMTELGADTVLLWNPSFYGQFCPLVLDNEVCIQGYAQLKEEEQSLLRGALAVSSDVECPECESGINLNYSGYSIMLFAQSIKANCNQTGQIVTNTTNLFPGAVVNYEDLWKMTLVNYHAGPGCLSNAVQMTWNATLPLNWPNVSSFLEPGCQTAIDFVQKVSGTAGELLPTAVPPTPTPTFATTPGVITPTPSQPGTPAGYPTPGGGTPVTVTPGGYPTPQPGDVTPTPTQGYP